MSSPEIEAVMTLAKTKEHVEKLNQGVTRVMDALDPILRAAEAVKDESVQTLTRKANASFAQTKELLNAAGEECERLQGLGLQISEEPNAEVKAAGATRQITQEAGAKITQIMTQYVHRLINEDGIHILELSRLLRSQPASESTSVMRELSKETGASGVSVELLDRLSGVEFERLVSQLLEKMGFRTEMTKASGDGGVDVVATLDQPLTGGRYLIQCKRYAPGSTVGAATVREFYGALNADRHAIKGILITTAAFTTQATEFAEDLPIELVGRDRLQQLLGRHGLLHVGARGTHPLARLHHAWGCIIEILSDLGGPGSLLAQLRSAWESMVQKLPDFLRPSPDSAIDSGEARQAKDRSKMLFDSAIKMSEQKREGEAIKLLREAADLQPDNPDLWMWLGICYHSVGLHDDQIEALRQAVRLKTDFREAWYWLGSGLRKVGDLDGAIDALTRSNAISPDDPSTWLELGRTYWDSRKLGFEKGENVKVTDGPFKGSDGVVDEITGRSTLRVTVTAFGGSMPVEFDSSQVERTKAHERAVQKEAVAKEGALSAFNKAVAIKPDFLSAWFALGSLHYEQKEYREAISAFLEVVRINPGHAQSWQMLVLGYFWIRDYNRMEQAVNSLDRVDPAKAREYRRNFLKK